MGRIDFSCRISTTDSSVPLGFEIWVDNQLVYNNDYVKDTVYFEHDLADLTDGAHQLQFILKNKLPLHTTVVDGQITKDAVITVDQMTINRIDVDHLFNRLASYVHDYNGTDDAVEERFYGKLGCNGTVNINFFAPVHLWLLEHI